VYEVPEVLFIDTLWGSLILEPDVREAFALMLPQPTRKRDSFLRDPECWDGDACVRVKWFGHGSIETFQSLITVLQATTGAADLVVRWSDGFLFGLRVVDGIVTRHAVGRSLLAHEPHDPDPEEE
jgi:hypothetical protein